MLKDTHELLKKLPTPEQLVKLREEEFRIKIKQRQALADPEARLMSTPENSTYKIFTQSPSLLSNELQKKFSLDPEEAKGAGIALSKDNKIFAYQKLNGHNSYSIKEVLDALILHEKNNKISFNLEACSETVSWVNKSLDLKKNGQKIVKIALYYNTLDWTDPLLNLVNNGTSDLQFAQMRRELFRNPVIILSFSDGAKNLYTLPLQYLYSFISWLAVNGAASNAKNSFLGFRTLEQNYWDDLQNYNNGITTAYQFIHYQIKIEVLKLLTANKLIQKNKNITFIELCCGDGSLLKGCLKEVAKLGRNCIGYGIDSNGPNILTARKDSPKNCHFIHSDIFNLDKLLSEISLQGEVIFLGSGALYRKVLPGFDESIIHLLQTIYHKGNHLILSGATEPLINKKIAKLLGFTVSITRWHPDDLGANVIVFNKSNVSHLLKNDKAEINLSLNPDPVKYLNYLNSQRDHLSSLKTLKLMLAKITQDNVDDIIALLNKLPVDELHLSNHDTLLLEKLYSPESKIQNENSPEGNFCGFCFVSNLGIKQIKIVVTMLIYEKDFAREFDFPEVIKKSALISSLSNQTTFFREEKNYSVNEAHQLLLKEINSIANNITYFEVFIKLINEKAYTKALRTACNSAKNPKFYDTTIKLINVLLKYKDVFSIDINEKAGQMQYSAIDYAKSIKDDNKLYQLLISHCEKNTSLALN